MVEETDDRLLVDASAGTFMPELPQASKVGHQMVTSGDTDRTDRDVVLEPLGGLAGTGGRRGPASSSRTAPGTTAAARLLRLT